jgi:outer membrane murein-binding lipoprotein Lpp
MGKKRALVLGLALVGAVAVAGMGLAGCQKGPLFCGGGFHGKDFPKHVLEKIDTEVEALNLSAAQMARYEEIRTKAQNELVEAGSQRKAFFEKVKIEMDREDPDLNALSVLVKSHVDKFPTRAHMFIDDFMAFYEILDDNQKAVITTYLKDRFKKFEAFKALMSS